MSQDVRSTGVSPLDPRSIHRPPNPASPPLVVPAAYNLDGARLRQVRGAPVGLYKRRKSPYWWMSYMVDGKQFWESTKTSSRNAAQRIWKRREAEIALGKFKVGWPGQWITFDGFCDEFEKSHFAGISKGTIKGYRVYLTHLKAFFGGVVLTKITAKQVEEYRDHRRTQPCIRDKGRTLKG